MNMELQEIDDRLKALEKEIEEREGRREYSIFLENLVQEQEKLLLRVCKFCTIALPLKCSVFFQRQKLIPSEKTCHIHQGNGPYPVENIPGCWFFKIPHKVSGDCSMTDQTEMFDIVGWK